ncbi:MAG: anhydro-N-acetylmuramic acid kinase [Azospirillaceae bacterium]
MAMVETGMRRAIGMISGTSMDGLDIAFIETDGETVSRFGPTRSYSYEPALRRRLLEIAANPDEARKAPLVEEDRAVTLAHVDGLSRFATETGVALAACDVVGMHGQTILHLPRERFTRQLGDGQDLADAIGVTVIDRLRHDDVAAGGEGAPFAPLYHAALARSLRQPVAVLNLGGVGNVTYLDGDAIVAFDTGPANAMIDDWVWRHRGMAFDAGGAIAASGRVDREALARLMDNPYFDLAPPKSLDRNDFPADPVGALGVEDGAATLAAFTIESVARAVAHLPSTPLRWLVTGGGRHNATLMGGLAERLGVPVAPVEAVGWDGDALEAQMVAFLAVRSLRRLPLSIPSTTGVPEPMTGGRRCQPRPNRPTESRPAALAG